MVEVFSYVNAYDVVICHRFGLAMNGCWVVFVAGKNGSSGVTDGWHPHYKADLIWFGVGQVPISSVECVTVSGGITLPRDYLIDRDGNRAMPEPVTSSFLGGRNSSVARGGDPNGCDVRTVSFLNWNYLERNGTRR